MAVKNIRFRIVSEVANNVSEEYTASIFMVVQYGGSRILRNVVHLRDCRRHIQKIIISRKKKKDLPVIRSLEGVSFM
jgi:hypothetical protein